jgi:prophage tail gpP-like protein
MPNPAEVAQLRVEDIKFEDWETVWVKLVWKEGWPLFRFTAAEYTPIPAYWTSLQFKPGDQCDIFLGGVLAISGVILTRQTSYDAKSHVVELSGVGRQWTGLTSSVGVNESKDGSYDNMSLLQIAQKLMAPHGVGVLEVGTVDETPFEHAQVQPGELKFDVIDRFARLRDTFIGSDQYGNVLLIGAGAGTLVPQQLIEGENILKMQCIISQEFVSTIYATTGQAVNGNQMSARQAAEMQAEVPGSLSKKLFKYIQTVMEQPGTQKDVIARAYYEARFREGTQIRAFVTVQGWLRDGTNIWRPGDDVYVYAPMAMLDMPLKIQSATFQQDNRSGTTTIIECVPVWDLGDQLYKTQPGGPPPPDPGKTTSDQAPATFDERFKGDAKPDTPPSPTSPLYNPYAPPGL